MNKFDSEFKAGRESVILLLFRNAYSLARLDRTALRLADQGHRWTALERATYERRVRELK